MTMIQSILNITQPGETTAFTVVKANDHRPIGSVYTESIHGAKTHVESPSFKNILAQHSAASDISPMKGNSTLPTGDLSLAMFGLESTPANITTLSAAVRHQTVAPAAIPDFMLQNPVQNNPIRNTTAALNLYAANTATLPDQSNKSEFYLDTKDMDSLKYSGDKEASLRKASAQFEALFVQQMIKGMRTATAAISDEDNPLSHIKKDDPFQDMLDNKMAISMTNNGGIGLADMLYKQLSKINR